MLRTVLAFAAAIAAINAGPTTLGRETLEEAGKLIHVSLVHSLTLSLQCEEARP